MSTQATVPHRSRYVPRQSAMIRAIVMSTAIPRRNVGTAMARLGPMRRRISRPISRSEASDRPRSKTINRPHF